MPGGPFLLGAPGDASFVFDNEVVSPDYGPTFRIAQAQVTNAEFAAFVDDGGYAREGSGMNADGPGNGRTQNTVYWQRDGAGGWIIRAFDETSELQPHRAVIHVNWYEASAWCRWAGHRPPGG